MEGGWGGNLRAIADSGWGAVNGRRLGRQLEDDCGVIRGCPHEQEHQGINMNEYIFAAFMKEYSTASWTGTKDTGRHGNSRPIRPTKVFFRP
jgi:hypothetical protein